MVIYELITLKEAISFENQNFYEYYGHIKDFQIPDLPAKTSNILRILVEK